jgi:hypothetical protein
MKPFQTFFGLFLILTLSSSSCEFDSKPKATSEVETKTKATTQKFLFLSDIHLNTDSLNTDYGWDTGMKLWNAFLAKADSVIVAEKPNFIVYTGDLPAHYDAPSFFLPKPLRANHNKNIKTILEGLRNLADKQKTPLFYLPGNNDAIAGDYYSFTDEDGDTPLSLVSEKKNPYPALNIDSTGTQAPFILDIKNLNKGYYTAQLTDDLRLIALNTVIYSRHYKNVDGGTQLGYGDAQMKWLDDQLKAAKKAGDKAYIAMHIPPGNDAYGVTHARYPYNWVGTKPSGNGSWNNEFLKVIADHTPTITGILYGHTHMDELRRLYDPAGTNITEVAISCPGVTPQHYNNPGFKIVTYDTSSQELLDFTTYHTVPSATTWGAATYNFNDEFSYSSSNTLFENVSQDNIDSVHVKLNKIYTVKNGNPSYDIESGIEVKTEN